MRLASLSLAAVLGSFLFLAAARPPAPVQATQDKGFCEDTRYGFRFRAPKEWTLIPLKLEEQWQVAKYLSNKPYFYTEPNGGWTYEHKPQATLIAFMSEKVREEAKAAKQKDEKQDRYVILLSNPYKDYLDYMKRTYSGGGWYKDVEKNVKVGDLDVTQYEIKVEKLTNDGPKRVICWVFHTPEVDFAFHWEVLEDALPKLKDTIYDTLKSFKLIPRTGGGLPAAQTGETGGVIIVKDDSKEQTPAERKAKRIALEQSLHAKAKTSVSGDWQVLQVGRFLVLNHTKEDYARRVAEHSEAVMAWLDKSFQFIGPEEYVRAPILRICKNYDEENAFHTGSTYIFSENRIEIVVSQDDMGFVTGNAVERVNRQLLQLWFFERDEDLSYAMPFWIVRGLSMVIGNSRAKGNKLEFRNDDWARDGIRERIRDGKLTKTKDLLRMGTEEYMSSAEGFFGREWEAGSLVRYFVTGAASKNPRTKDLLRDYLKNMKATIVEIKAAEKAAGKGDEKAPTTEKEEEERYKASSQRWKQREKQLLDTTFEKTFHGWSDDDWEAFDAAFVKSVS